MTRPPLIHPDPIADLAKQVAILTSQFNDLRKNLDQSSPSSISRSTSTNNDRPRLKLDVPRFDGSDTHGWIFKISQFFAYHHTPEEERITVASSYLDGAALAWYQWMYGNGQIVSWVQFLEKLEIRFPPQPPPFQNRTPQTNHPPVTDLLMKRKCDIESRIRIGKETENEKIEDNLILGPPPWEPPPYLPQPSPLLAQPPKIISSESKEKRENNFSSVNMLGNETNILEIKWFLSATKDWEDKMRSKPSTENTKRSESFMKSTIHAHTYEPLPSRHLAIPTPYLTIIPSPGFPIESFDSTLSKACGSLPFPSNAFTTTKNPFAYNLIQFLQNQQKSGATVRIIIDQFHFIWAPWPSICDWNHTIWSVSNCSDFGKFILLKDNDNFDRKGSEIFSDLMAQFSEFLDHYFNLEDKVDCEGVGNDMILCLLRRLDRSNIRIGIG